MTSEENAPKDIPIGELPSKRRWTNNITHWVVASGGGAVVILIALMFGYLLWTVAPMFAGAAIEYQSTLAVSEKPSVLIDVSESSEIILHISRDGQVSFTDIHTNKVVQQQSLGIELSAAMRVYPELDLYLLIDSQFKLRLMQVVYSISFSDNERVVTPQISYPYGKRPIVLSDVIQWRPPFDAQLFGDQLVLTATVNKSIYVAQISGLIADFPPPPAKEFMVPLGTQQTAVYLGPRNQWLYALDKTDRISVIDISDAQNPALLFRTSMAEEDAKLTALAPLLGRYSLVAGYDDGRILQWSYSRNEAGTVFAPIRRFDLETPITALLAETRRKGFAAIGVDASLHLLYPTSGRVLASHDGPIDASASTTFSPRGDLLAIAQSADGRVDIFALDNQHPEISFSSLWQQVWYEGYDEPVYSWQSSSADNDFEPKFSLVPLAFGTMKAAFYALLFAIPIAIMGAIYTAYFMAPAMRTWVKPGIEIMAALPTVILGFIGGLWLAPIVESYLSSVLAILVVLPIGLFTFAILWNVAPSRLRSGLQGWHGLLVVPLIIITVYVAFDVGPYLENTLYGGDSKRWFREVMGLDYDQRNALVVGIIMGLAVVPPIFTIAEDALYGVPQHLVNGSLALGATQWQTLLRVVLLTASPGIFSAIMIGMGRAVGETMIVLMATGNTPLMEWNIFHGMRTFAANIAVELPEAEVNSSHYRILFLSALVLFSLTFLFNTIAEVVRQRLRTRYSSM